MTAAEAAHSAASTAADRRGRRGSSGWLMNTRMQNRCALQPRKIHGSSGISASAAKWNKVTPTAMIVVSWLRAQS